jgi:hypothetical protein
MTRLVTRQQKISIFPISPTSPFGNQTNKAPTVAIRRLRTLHRSTMPAATLDSGERGNVYPDWGHTRRSSNHHQSASSSHAIGRA